MTAYCKPKALPSILQNLPICDPNAIAHHLVNGAVLALGSNHDSGRYFDIVHQELSRLGKICASNLLVNPDFTSTKANPKPDYTNQAVVLTLGQSLTLSELEQKLKAIEHHCNRCREPKNTRNLVTMDIDILLIKTMLPSWIILANRYPFKAHEICGLAELSVESVKAIKAD